MKASATMAITALLLLAAGAAHAFPGEPAKCPGDAKKEVVLIPAARADSAPCNCETIVTCQNLDRNQARMTCQFFNAVLVTQVGNDASVIVAPGGSESCATDGPDPLGIRFDLAEADITSDTRMVGRVCASTKKMACDAILSCDCATPAGPLVTRLTTIVKKQRGD